MKKRNAAFLILYCEPFQDSESHRFLIATRWSGGYGFIGGVLNDGETVKSGLIRECKEEIGLDIKDKENQLEMLSETYLDKKNMVFTTMTLKMTESEIKEIWSNWREQGEMAEYEISGLSLMRMDDHIMNVFLKNQFAGKSKIELKRFIKKIKEKKG